MKLLILFTEGLTEEIVYSVIIEKLYVSSPKRLEEILKTFERSSEALKLLIEPIREKFPKTRLHCYEVRQNIFIILINCGDFETLKCMIRRFLSTLHIVVRIYPEAFKELNLRIVIAADRDLKPTESIKGLLTSLGLLVSEGELVKARLTENIELPIYIIEQGGSEDTATGEIEDLLKRLIEVLKPELRDIINNFEKTYSYRLTDKQRFLMYLTLLEDKPKIRSLHDIFREKVLKQVNKDHIRKTLQNLLTVLEKALNQ